jgi:hypothetical protein
MQLWYKHKAPHSCLVLCLILCFQVLAMGQINTADIIGTITDPSGAVFSGATVTAMHLGTQQTQSVQTNQTGQYLLLQLPLGEYRLIVSALGFKEAVQKNVLLHGGDHLRQDFSLAVGSASQTITVGTNPGLIQVESAEIRSIVEGEKLVGLALKGREFMELAILSPGVVNPPGGTRGDSLQQTGKLINVLGNRTGHNLFLLDGVSITDEYFNNVALSPSPDVTQEFSIDLTDYSAEFGGKSGAVVNVITRSGTNDVHGSAYEFARNNALDAQNFFALPNVATPFHEHQFGLALGGPIVRNRMFFFVNYDGQRVGDSLAQLFTVPTALERGGNLVGLGAVHDPVTKAVIANNDLNNDPNFNRNNPSTKAAIALLNLLPLPTGLGSSNNLLSAGSQKIITNQYNGRLDQQISASDSAFIRVSIFDANELDPFGSSVLNEALLPGFGRILKTHSVNLSLGETHIFSPNIVNEFRFGWLRVSGGQKDPNAGNRFASTFGLSGTTTNPADIGYPQVNLSGLLSTIGTATGFNTRIDRNFEIFDNASLHHGKHDFIFGVYFFSLAFNPMFPNNARGTYTFNGSYTGNPLADFLFGYPSQGQVGIGEGAENAYTHWAHFYFQDGWQLAPRLKLDLGIRYEYNSNLAARANQTSNIDLSTGAARFVVAGNPANLAGNPALLTGFAAGSNPSIPVISNTSIGWNDSLLNARPLRLAPRIGLAWQVPGLDGAVVRAGFGIFTNQAAYSVLQNLAENIPFFLNKTVNNTLTTPTLTTSDILAANPNGAIGANGVNHDFKVEYNEVWNLALQKSLFRNTALSLRYVGSRTVHADSSTAVNLPLAGPGAVQPRRPVPNLNSFTVIRWDGWASFQGLTIEGNHRISRGLSLDASYTWSHSIDDGSDAGPTNAEFNLPQNIYANNLAVEKGDSSFDHRNRFVADILYDLPCAKAGAWSRAALAGWRVGGIFIAQSGSPFTVNLSPANDVANIGLVNGNNLERPNVTGNPNAGPKTTTQWFNTAAFSLPSAFTFGNSPRNSVIGPGFVNLDTSLQKEWALREPVNLQLRMDAYNTLNHPNFNLPGRIFGAANFGVIQSALDPRELQLGIKLRF